MEITTTSLSRTMGALAPVSNALNLCASVFICG